MAEQKGFPFIRTPKQKEAHEAYLESLKAEQKDKEQDEVLLREIADIITSGVASPGGYCGYVSSSDMAKELLAKAREAVEGVPLADHSHRRFKPNHKGYSSCIECEKNMAEAERQAILKALGGE